MRPWTVMVSLTFAEGGFCVENFVFNATTLLQHCGTQHAHLAGGCRNVQVHGAKVAQPMLRGCANPISFVEVPFVR